MTILDTEALTVDDVLLVPQLGIVKSREKDVTLHPYIYSAPMDKVTGYNLAKAMLANNEFPVISRSLKRDEWLLCLRDFANTDAFFALGAKPVDLLTFLKDLAEVFQDDVPQVNIAIDIAHGDSIVAYEAIAFLREYTFVKNIMSGSICTPQAAIRSVEAGCTHLRIGVGPGSVCTTRLMTGFGIPQLYAVYHIAQLWNDNSSQVKLFSTNKNLPKPILIADGGIRTPGDANKYLAAGADAIMIGSLLSDVQESANWEQDGGLLVKQYRGQASAEYQLDTKGKANRCPEGVSTKRIVFQGKTLESIIDWFRGGLATGISYAGLTDQKDFITPNVHFIKITSAGLNESKPHNPHV